MLIKYTKIAAIVVALLPLYGCAHKQSTYDYHEPVVMHDIPAPREVVAIPTGYVNCKVIQETYADGSWRASHRVCYYHKKPGKAVWVEGYWYCPRYTNYGQCGSWTWRPGHWSKVDVIY